MKQLSVVITSPGVLESISTITHVVHCYSKMYCDTNCALHLICIAVKIFGRV